MKKIKWFEFVDYMNNFAQNETYFNEMFRELKRNFERIWNKDKWKGSNKWNLNKHRNSKRKSGIDIKKFTANTFLNYCFPNI